MNQLYVCTHICVYVCVCVYICICIYLYIYTHILFWGFPDFPGGSNGKVSVYNVGDLGSIPGSGSSLEKEMATRSRTLA